MKLKKIISLGLICCLLLLPVAGCGSDAKGKDGSDLSVTESADISNHTATATSEENDTDYSQLLLGMSADTVLADIDESTLDANLYTYWLTYYEKQVYDQYGADVNWEQVADTVTATTLNDYVKAEALQTAATYILLEQKAAEYDITLTEEQQDTLDDLEATYREEFGDEEYEQNLQLETVSLETLKYMQKVQYYHENLMSEIFAEDGDLYPTEEELQSYIEDNGSYKVKYIWYATTDEDGAALSEEAREKLKDEVSQKAADLQSSDDPAAAFDELYTTDNEDQSESGEGELAYSGRYTTSFEDAALALEENEISGLVEDEDYGFFIIERLPLTTEDVAESYLTEAKSDKLNEWMQAADAATTDVYADIDVESYYESLLTYLHEIDADTYALRSTEESAEEATEESSEESSDTTTKETAE